MPNIMTSFKDIQPAGDFEPLPIGMYAGRVVSGEVKTSQAGNDYLRLQMEVFNDENPDNDGRKFSANLHFTENSLQYTLRALLALGFDEEELNSDEVALGPDDFLNRECAVRLSIEESDEANPLTGQHSRWNNVSAWYPLSAE